MLYLHVTLVPFIEAAGELKTKPTQHSVNELRRIGIHPDAIVCRSRDPLSEEIRDKIALFADVDPRAVFSSPDVPDVYLVPEHLMAEAARRVRLRAARARDRPADLAEWRELTDRIGERRDEVEIALVGKYVKLHDAYLSVHEALKHAGVAAGTRVRVRWVDAEDMSYEEAVEELEQVDGVLVPGGFGSRGLGGEDPRLPRRARAGIPYLGICLGMHVAVSEFARHVVGLDGANSTEMDPETPYPVIDLLPEQKEIEELGGTMRLGAQAVEARRGHPHARDLRRRRDPRGGTATATRSTTSTADSSSSTASSSRARSSRGASSRSSSCPTTPGSSRASSTRSSSRARRGPRRSSASSSRARSSERAPRQGVARRPRPSRTSTDVGAPS